MCLDTLEKLRAGDLDALAGRLDWVLKLRILQRAMAQRPQLNWRSPEMKHLDHLYSSLDATEGLYWIYENLGAVERVSSPAQVERLLHEPPEDTRAYGRAMLLRLAGENQISRVDWDAVTLRTPGRYGSAAEQTVAMHHPYEYNRAAVGRLLES